jgi:hypothetical protein
VVDYLATKRKNGVPLQAELLLCRGNERTPLGTNAAAVGNLSAILGLETKKTTSQSDWW